MMSTPTVRLELEGMKQSIVTALANYNSELEKIVNNEIDKQVKAFDFNKYVKEAVQEALISVVDSSVRREIGFHFSQEIHEAVRRTVIDKLSKETQ